MQVKELKPLITSPHWPLMEDYLLFSEEQLVNALVNSNDKTESDVLKGQVRQIRRIRQLQDSVSLL